MANYIYKTYKWISVNVKYIVVIILVFVIIRYLTSLPYINLITIVITPIAYVVSWIIIVFLFRPDKDKILLVALGLFGFSYFLSLLNFSELLEIVGEVAYLLIATYIVMAVKELIDLRKQKPED